MVTTTTPVRLDVIRTSVALRAVAAAIVGIVITFAGPLHRSAEFGLIAFGAFEVVQGAIVAFGARGARTATGRTLALMRAGVCIVLGILALLLAQGELGTLLLLLTTTFLIAGVLEVLQGARRADNGPESRDAIVVGGLSMIVGAVVLLVTPDTVFAIGMVGAWAVIVAVYLGIAAVSLKPQQAIPAADDQSLVR